MGGEGSKGGKDVGGGDVEGWEGGGGGVTSFAESLHPRKPSCVLLLL